MVDVLQQVGGRMTPVPFDGASVEWKSEEDYLKALEEARRAAVQLRRAYYDGRQYDARNAQCRQDMLDALGGNEEEKAVARAMAFWDAQLPEHLRMHEYTTAIQESVDFVANRLADSARVVLESSDAQTVVDGALDSSPELAGSPDDDELVLSNVFREALKAGDTPVLVRWNGDDAGTCWPEFWDSEQVELRFADDQSTVVKAIVQQVDWRMLPGSSAGEPEPCVIRRVWEVLERATLAEVPVPTLEELALATADPTAAPPDIPDGVRLECAERVYWVKSDREVLLEVVWWGVPFLPWWPVRGDRKTLRATRGEALISDQTMKTADRYNAVQHTAWRIARYNSHSRIALTGDAMVVEGNQAKHIRGDVADVSTFPGATNATVLSLPTDPQMINQQTGELKAGLYASMGVTQTDQTSLEGLGGVTGYALEILDQKSDGTFSRVRLQLQRDLKRLVNLILDCHAYWSQAHLAKGQDDQTPAGQQATSYLQVDPASVFPKRGMEIRLGSGHIVDDARIRDDFVVKLISLQEALRQKGRDDDDIKKIVGELQEAQEQAAAAQRTAFGETGTEGAGNASTQTGNRFASTNRPDPAEGDSDANATGGNARAAS